jgi:hypothetical protein
MISERRSTDFVLESKAVAAAREFPGQGYSWMAVPLLSGIWECCVMQPAGLVFR